jgi:hypothetical protein
MTSSPSQVFYTIIEETDFRLLFTRTPKQRWAAGLALGGVALVLFGTSLYSYLRPQRDLGGFIFFLLVGVIVAGMALYNGCSWMEIEFDALQRSVIRRYRIGNRVHTTERLQFEQIERINIRKTWGETVDACHIQLFIKPGRVWTTLPGYLVENQAREVRHKILALIQKTD